MPAKNIAIFGGAFDPFHIGHLISITNILNNHCPRIDQVVVMPSGKRLDKEYYLDDASRLGYIKRAIKGYRDDEVVLDDTDLKGDFDGTYSLVEHLRARIYAEVSLYFVIGDDLIEDLPKWRHAEKLRTEVRFLVLPRNRSLVELPDNYEMSLIMAPFKLQISSTQIRELLERDACVQGLIAPLYI